MGRRRDLRGALRLPGALLAWATLPGLAVAQTLPAEAPLPDAQARAAAAVREVVSKQIAVGRDEATLSLEFRDRGTVEVAFQDGSVRLDGRTVGAYQRGDALETAWRTLLGEAVALDDGPLAVALRAWTPPTGLDAEAAAVARQVDEALEAAVALQGGGASAAGGQAIRAGTEAEVMAALLGRTARLVELAAALDDLDLDDVRIHVGEDVTVEDDEELEATLVVVEGDVEVHGEVDGHVVVVGGSVRLHDGSLVRGDVRVADGEFYRYGGELDGEYTHVAADARSEGRVRIDPDQIEREVERRIRAEMEEADFRGGRGRDSGPGFLNPLRHVGRGLSGIVSNLITILMLTLIGGVALHFGREKVEVVARTAQRAPARAGVVGLAGAFLVLPVWVLGAVALAISIIGIPVLLAWVPLFPVAVCLAAGMGYLAVAQNLGEWVARQHYPQLEWVRISNPHTTVLAGVAALMLPFVAGHVVQMVGPILGFLRGLLVFTGVLATGAAVLVGFGAVLLTRAGRQPEYYGRVEDFEDGGWDDDFSAPPSPSAGPRESGWDPGPAGGRPGPDPAGGGSGPAGEETP